MIKKKAVVYARYSSTNQREESIERQLESVREYCQRNNLDIVDEYIDEAQSAVTDRRDDFQRMMDDAMVSDWHFIVVYKMDRLSRSVSDAMHYKKKLSSVGKRILSVIEDYDESTPEGGFFNLITLGISEFYVKNLAREAFAGQMQNAKRAMSAGGPPPLGYSFNKEKKLVINQKEAEAVRLIFKMFVEGYTYRDIATTLNEKGYRTRYGNKFSIHFHDTLKNRKYIGEYVYNLASKKGIDGTRNHHKKKPESEVIRIPGAVPQIIEDDVFKKAQEILKKRQVDPYNALIRGKYMLTGLVKCGNCHYRMAGHTNHNGRNDNIRIIYRCKTKQIDPKCKTKPINVKYLDNYILGLISDLIKTKNRPKFNKFIKIVQDETMIRIKSKIVSLEKDIESCKHEIQERAERIASSKRSVDKLLSEQMNDYVELLEQSKVEKAKLNYDFDLLKNFKLSNTTAILKELRERINKASKKRRAVFDVVHLIVIDNKKVVISLKFNKFINQDIHEKILYEHVVNRDDIAIKFNHTNLQYIFS